MATATKQIGQTGAILTKFTPAYDNTTTDEYIYTGSRATFSTWGAEILEQYASARTSSRLNIHDGVVELTIRFDGNESTVGRTSEDARTPTLSITIGQYARPIETIDSPTDFTKISADRIVQLREYVDTAKVAKLKALTDETEKAYVKLYGMGITARNEPSLTATATRYIKLNKSFSAEMRKIDEVLAWSDVVEWLGDEKAKYVNPDGNLKWIVSGVGVSIHGSDYAEVSKSFTGVYYLPKELYNNVK